MSPSSIRHSSLDKKTQTGASRRDGQELGEALKGVPGNMEVAMADEMSVVLAEVPGRAFVSVGIELCPW